MKYLKQYEMKFAYQYIIVKNHYMFRGNDIKNILFTVGNFKHSPDSLILNQIKIGYKNGSVEYCGGEWHQYSYDEIYPHIIYKTDNLQDAEDILPKLLDVDKYNI